MGGSIGGAATHGAILLRADHRRCSPSAAGSDDEWALTPLARSGPLKHAQHFGVLRRESEASTFAATLPDHLVRTAETSHEV